MKFAKIIMSIFESFEGTPTQGLRDEVRCRIVNSKRGLIFSM